jgi:hypothetical protein
MSDIAFDATPIIGLRVKLDRPTDRQRPCCRNIVIVERCNHPRHAAALHCADCGQDRGWLSSATAKWITFVVKRFGAPPMVTVRPATITTEEEAPATDTHS